MVTVAETKKKIFLINNKGGPAIKIIAFPFVVDYKLVYKFFISAAKAAKQIL